MASASRWNRRASARISDGSVAESSSVRRVGGRRAEQRLQILAKPEVQHLVRLVEHHHPTSAQRQPLAAHQVDQTPGRADGDVDAALKRPQIAADRRPARERREAQAGARQQPTQLLAHLGRQLARRHDDQRARRGRADDRRRSSAGAAASRPSPRRTRWSCPSRSATTPAGRARRRRRPAPPPGPGRRCRNRARRARAQRRDECSRSEKRTGSGIGRGGLPHDRPRTKLGDEIPADDDAPPGRAAAPMRGLAASVFRPSAAPGGVQPAVEVKMLPCGRPCFRR